MVREELPNELFEIISQVLVEASDSLIGLIEGFPVPLFIIFEYVLIQDIRFLGLNVERHHSSYHNEKDDTQSKNISRTSFVRLALYDLRCHVSLSTSMSIENTYHTTLRDSLCKGEVAYLKIEITIN
jgi:type III secretory pathway component EscV